MTEEKHDETETASPRELPPSMKEPLHSREPDVGNVAAALGDAYHADGLSGPYYLSASDSLARVNARLEAVRDYAARLREPMPDLSACSAAERVAWASCAAHGREILALIGCESLDDGTGETTP